MVKIKLNLTVSEKDRHFTVTPSNLNLSQEEWDEMSEDEKEAALVEYVESIQQPYWDLESFAEQ